MFSIATPITTARWERVMTLHAGSPVVQLELPDREHRLPADRPQLGHPPGPGHLAGAPLRRPGAARRGRRARRRDPRHPGRHVRVADVRRARRPPGARPGRRRLRPALPDRAVRRAGSPAPIPPPGAGLGWCSTGRCSRSSGCGWCTAAGAATTTPSWSRGRAIPARWPRRWPPAGRGRWSGRGAGDRGRRGPLRRRAVGVSADR